MDLNEAAEEMRRLSRLLDQGLQAMRDQAREVAESEQNYRQAVGEAWLVAPEGTVPEREAWVNARTADRRHRRDLAEGMARAAYQAVRARQTQVSSLQSLLSAHRAEAELANYGPTP